MKSWISIGLLTFLTLTFVFAHEFYLLPSNFRPGLGEEVNIAVLVGEYFQGEPWVSKSYQPIFFKQFFGKKTTDLTAKLGQKGSDVTHDEQGSYLYALQTGNKYIELEAAKFLSYLKEDGLDNVIALREKRKEQNLQSKEFFARCAKTLIQVGDKTTASFAVNTKMTLEIIPSKNPYTLAPGDALSFQILFHGKPLAGAKIRYWNRIDKVYTEIAQLSDKQGNVSFQLKKGPSMVSIVTMEATPAGSKADWQSWWGSYTFAL